MSRPNRQWTVVYLDTMTKPVPFDILEKISKVSAPRETFRIGIILARTHHYPKIRDDAIPFLSGATPDAASGKGQIELLEWWKRRWQTDPRIRRLKWTSQALVAASKNGHVNVLQWFLQNDFFGKDRKHITSHGALDWASTNGHAAVLQWWICSGLRLDYSERALDGARANNHVNVIRWWDRSGLRLRYTENGISTVRDPFIPINETVYYF